MTTAHPTSVVQTSITFMQTVDRLEHETAQFEAINCLPATANALGFLSKLLVDFGAVMTMVHAAHDIGAPVKLTESAIRICVVFAHEYLEDVDSTFGKDVICELDGLATKSPKHFSTVRQELGAKRKELHAIRRQHGENFKRMRHLTAHRPKTTAARGAIAAFDYAAAAEGVNAVFSHARAMTATCLRLLGHLQDWARESDPTT